MTNRAWAIKLGSAGKNVPFCERHHLIGVGWKTVDTATVLQGSRAEVQQHVRDVCTWYKTERERSVAASQLWRFARECQVGDLVAYYDPPRKQVRICRVVSEMFRRDVDLEDPADIWHVRKIEYACDPIPILDFHGVLKGRLLGPRMSFWALHPAKLVEDIATGTDVIGPPDPELTAAYQQLRGLVLRRAEALDAQDWEWLVVDFFKAQGAHVDEHQVGGSRPIIDLEAIFDQGELGEDKWRVQVKRYQDRRVDWPEIGADLQKVGEARFCFVSVYGFTDLARQRADDEDVRLLEAGDFVRFLLGGKMRERLRAKLKLPMMG